MVNDGFASQKAKGARKRESMKNNKETNELQFLVLLTTRKIFQRLISFLCRMGCINCGIVRHSRNCWLKKDSNEPVKENYFMAVWDEDFQSKITLLNHEA